MITNKHIRNKGQHLLEHILMISIIVGVLAVFGIHFKRGIQGLVKTAADQLALQNEAEQVADPDKRDVAGGYIVNAFVTTRAQLSKQLIEVPGGDITYVFDDIIDSDSFTLTNLGFTNVTE